MTNSRDDAYPYDDGIDRADFVLVETLDEIRKLLADGRAWTTEDLADELIGSGVDLGEFPEDVVYEALEEDESDLLRDLADERWVHLPSLLAGRVFTHRLTAEEIAYDVIDMDPDLRGVDAIADDEDHQSLVDGRRLESFWSFIGSPAVTERGIPEDLLPEDGLLLPAGLLAGLGAAAGDLLGLRVTPAGWEVALVPDSATTEGTRRLADALWDSLDTALPDEPIEVGEAVWAACAADPGLLTSPAAPLTEVLANAGFARHGDFMAQPGFDFVAWSEQLQARMLSHRYPLDETQARTASGILREVRLLAADPPDPDGPPRDAPGVVGLLPGLRDELVGVVVITESCRDTTAGPEALIGFVDRYQPIAPRQAQVALAWLRGRALEFLGEAAAAERQYEAARSLDPLWPPVLAELATFAADRGDAERALTLYQRIGLPDDDPEVAAAMRCLPPRRPDLGRNSPCWCGSGRKYKQCHLGREQRPLLERSRWLYEKAIRYATTGRWQLVLADVLNAGMDASGETIEPEDLMRDAGVFDAMLIEGGALAAYLAERGYLLPEDERLLVAEWLLTQRSLMEVVGVRRGVGMTVRDLRTGDRHEIEERLGSRSLKPGQYLCLRVADAGGSTQAYGLVPVPDHMRDWLMEVLDAEPDAIELVGALSQRFAPPTLQNTEGHALVESRAVLHVPDPAALAAALDRRYDADSIPDLPDAVASAGTASGITAPDGASAGGTRQWFDNAEIGGFSRLRAMLALDGDRLTIETNSVERMDEVLTAVTALAPGLALLRRDEDAVDTAAMMRRAHAGVLPGGGLGIVDDLTPEQRDALEAMVRQYETAWLDDSIPALGGLTPRAAAVDPTRRGDLIRLLETMPSGQPGAMDAARMRAALGLE